MNQQHIITQNASILEALSALNSLTDQVMTLVVTDETGVMTGTLTDGDIRRSLLKGTDLSASVTKAMHRSFKCLRGETVNVSDMRRYRQAGIRLLPHLDDSGTIKRLYDLTKTKTILPLSAILMAGGKGERLRPLTSNTPKPLLNIGGKAIIDYNIEALAASGITDISVTTGYLAEKIHDHFASPVAGVQVKCVQEPRPMGTIGSASLVKRDSNNSATIVMNSDLLTTISFEEMYLKHQQEKADITIAAVPYIVSVPYAILTTEQSQVTGIEEKPAYSYYANAGIYIFSNDLLDSIDKEQRTDATELIERAIAGGRKVVYYAINGTWIDVGSHTDFKHAQEIMKHHNDLIS